MRNLAPLFTLVTLATCSTLAACGSEPAGTDTAERGDNDTSPGDDAALPPASPDTAPPAEDANDADGDAPGPNATVVAFDGRPIYFTGADNQRSVASKVRFPETGTYARVTLYLTLTCPEGGCDAWDRRASIGVERDGAVIEVARFVTPFGVGMSVSQDVTDLRPLLSGEVTLRAFIDTWVGPGSPYGAGWLLTALFIFEGGVPARVPVAVVPLLTERSVPYGDPAQPVSRSAPDVTLALPAGATSAAVRAFITGHGQGNADNCAEFCARTHSLTLGEVREDRDVWRADCPQTGAPDQQGSWRYPRAGWCPGAMVEPWVLMAPGPLSGDLTATYAIEPWENSCRPDASPCAGCVFDTGCAYNDSSHTAPFFQVSTVLIAYR